MADRADTDEIEITPEMIAAGVFSLREFQFGQSLEEIVRTVYLDMAIERQSRIKADASAINVSR